jgi:CRP/FNR family cyclic AMP-dependent transcriptional regulator
MDPDIAEALSKSYLAGLPSEVVDPLFAGQMRVDYPSGTTIYRGGDPPRVLLVISGLIRLYVKSREGREVTIRYGRATDILGTPLVVGGPIDVNAMTLEPTSAAVIDPRRLADTARRDVRLAYAMAEEMGLRLYDMIQQVSINTFGSVRQRVASHLLDLASMQQRREGTLEAHATQQELADSVGSVREVVARALRDLRRLGIVATSTDSVVILDPMRLHEEYWGTERP